MSTPKKRAFHIHLPRPPGLVVEREFIGGKVHIHGNVCSVLATDGVIQSVERTHNIITDQGDLFYAEMGDYMRAPATHQVSGDLFTDNATPSLFDGVVQLWKTVTPSPGKTSNYDDLTGTGTLIEVSTGVDDKGMETGYPLKDDTANTPNEGAQSDAITYKVSYTTAQVVPQPNTITDVIITNPAPGVAENLLMWSRHLRTKTGSDTLDIYINHTVNGV